MIRRCVRQGDCVSCNHGRRQKAHRHITATLRRHTWDENVVRIRLAILRKERWCIGTLSRLRFLAGKTERPNGLNTSAHGRNGNYRIWRHTLQPQTIARLVVDEVFWADIRPDEGFRRWVCSKKFLSLLGREDEATAVGHKRTYGHRRDIAKWSHPVVNYDVWRIHEVCVYVAGWNGATIIEDGFLF